MDVLQTKWIRSNGLDFAYLEAGEPGAPLVLCLHGFPDTPYGFAPILPQLAAAGFRAVAPFMRGYAPSGLAPDGDYSALALGQDVLALIEDFGESQASVVGHDWGTVATYAAAILRPDRVRRIVVSAVPHLRRFLLRPTPAQLKRSHYIFKFQAPFWAEKVLPRDDFAWIENVLIKRWSPNWHYTAADLAPLKAGFSEPGRLKAALAYYRAIPRVFADRGVWNATMKKVRVPTKMICGKDDGAIGPEMFTRQDKLFPAGLDLSVFEDAGHFMQWEQPDRFARAVIDFLRKPGSGSV